MSKSHNTSPVWTRSSRCDHENCVEVSRHSITVQVRNSTDPGTTLSFTHDSWRSFLRTHDNPTR
ncbi:DUF397 domain-containing protein [Micromonospora craniellae]|uniref:DUF397 domain-containing protein n=1 Tax=Micromonospora craniellae TaxID=2294034 RepID=A0A372FUW7_9ACTN|nr:DUF397 domain-containing protein [Micromonospora craniellae]RFS44555.1 DUF397 domain-containing protein [Micromonospora craniellae]